jgi:hypothetical protein
MTSWWPVSYSFWGHSSSSVSAETYLSDRLTFLVQFSRDSRKNWRGLKYTLAESLETRKGSGERLSPNWGKVGYVFSAIPQTEILAIFLRAWIMLFFLFPSSYGILLYRRTLGLLWYFANTTYISSVFLAFHFHFSSPILSYSASWFVFLRHRGFTYAFIKSFAAECYRLLVLNN